VDGVVDDATLLERSRRGDAAAFSELFARHHRAIYRYALHMCGRDAGDDAVQETFLAVLNAPGRYDAERGSVIGYLLGIARHRILKRIDEDRTELDEASVTEVGPATVLDALTRQETIDTVRSAVRSLPATYREVVVLCELQEVDYVEAAAIIGCPVGTIRSRLHRARALLTAKLAALQPVVSEKRR